MLEVKGLTRYYGGKCAVDNISFSLEKGQILGFLGVNGAGKSTTMNMLTGYLAPTEGQVLVDGVSVWDNPVKAKAKIGYLPEKPPLYPDMTVWEYLDFMASMKRLKLPRRQHMEELCETLKLTEVRHRLIRNLSKGYGQRVGIAQALLGNPPLVILDEPTVGLDPNQMIEIRSLIRETGKHQAVILSSHILPHIQTVCDRILVLHRGKIMLDEKAGELTADGSRRFHIEICGNLTEAQAVIAGTQAVSEALLAERRGEQAGSFQVTVQEDYGSHRELLQALLERDISVEGLGWMRPDLEEIFLSLTGREGTDLGRREGGQRV